MGVTWPPRSRLGKLPAVRVSVMAKPLDPKDITKLAFGLYPHLFPGGEQEVNAESISERIERIRAGLEPETEFFATVSWLGRCPGIHRIDQTPMPVERQEKDLRAPDFIAFSNYKESRIPLLIEVKTSNEDKIEWTESYFNSQKQFAQLLDLPLLIAWKWNGIWLLCDVAHFQKKVTAYHLSIRTAFEQNLMSLLFGNSHIRMAEKFGFVLDCLLLDPKPERMHPLLPAGEYKMQIKGASFFVGDQELALSQIDPSIFALFLATPTTNEVLTIAEDRIKIIYRPEPETSFPLSHVLLTTLYMQHQSEEYIKWDEVLRYGPFAFSGDEIRNAFPLGFKGGFIQYVLEQVPETMPHFLQRLETSS